MFKATAVRGLLGLALALGVVIVSAAPVAAERILTDCTGTCGYWEVKDTGPTGPKGAVCVYERGSSYDLDKITVRPPLMHGNYATNTRVGWRFKILHQPVSGGVPFQTIYTSSWQKATATVDFPVYAGNFFRRAWSVPEDPHGFYQVWVEMRWWAPGGGVEGFVQLQYEWYNALRGSASYTNMEYCLEDY